MIELSAALLMSQNMIRCQTCRCTCSRHQSHLVTRRFQKVLYRIIAVDYHFPSRAPHGVVSETCKDLMRRIFVADPQQRITIPEIQAHPWYQQDLPPGLTGFNDICLAQQGQSGAPLSAQSEEQIRATVQEANVVRFSNSDQPVLHDDQDTDYIDDVMDQEYSYTACEF